MKIRSSGSLWARFAGTTIMFCAGLVVPAAAQLPSTIDDFFIPGTQPDTSGGKDFAFILHSDECRGCHESGANPDVPVYTRWAGSMMANAARDPLFHACMAIANQDAAFAGDLCLRCHVPAGWLAGRSIPTDGSALDFTDFDGVNCNFCHRMIDPVYRPGISPPEDQIVLEDMASNGLLPAHAHNGSYVVDPMDVRRGPYDDVPLNFHGVPIIHSPFHLSSDLCATCHDVSNPLYSRTPGGTYELNSNGAPHPSQSKYEMFPIERTFSEWANSEYASTGVNSGGVFGGNHPTGIMRTCRDCHMPFEDTYACVFDNPPFFQRPDVGSHDFHGGNTWVQEMIFNIYGNKDPQYYEYLQYSRAGALYMLQNAATLQVSNDTCNLTVRVINETGHKLPTGYPEGRRLWLSVKFLDAGDQMLVERGRYDGVSADLVTADTKVYEAELGVDAAVSAATGVPEGPSFHFALNNKYYKDNRIPPRGFTYAAFDAVGAAPVGAFYADGQYWDDTVYRIPPGAVKAEVALYYQTASKEYIEFLRDANTTNDAGDILYSQWEFTGKSPPVPMRQIALAGLANPAPAGDYDCDGDVDLDDYAAYWADCMSGPGNSLRLGCETYDLDLDGDIDLSDCAGFQDAFGS